MSESQIYIAVIETERWTWIGAGWTKEQAVHSVRLCMLGKGIDTYDVADYLRSDALHVLPITPGNAGWRF